MISSVDNFVAPVKEGTSLVTALRRADIANVSSMHVPTVDGFSQGNSLTTGDNVLLRYPVVGPDLSFKDTKHTPIIDPRHLETVRVHWATEYRPHHHHGGGRGPPRSLDPKESLQTIGVRTLHLMALTRPERDRGGSRSVDGVLVTRGKELQGRLQRRLGGRW